MSLLCQLAIGTVILIIVVSISTRYINICRREDTPCNWEVNGFIEEDEHLADVINEFEKKK